MADDKEKKLHIPKAPEKKEKELDITQKGKKEIIETLGWTIKSDDENFIPIYGEKPERAEVIKILKKRSPLAYEKAETREEVMKILEKNNPTLFHRLQRKEGKESYVRDTQKIPNEKIEDKIRDPKREKDKKNDKEVDKYLEDWWFDNKGWKLPEEGKEKDKKEEIKEKKAELVKEDKKPETKPEEKKPEAKPEVKEEKKPKEKKKRKRDLNPLNWIKYGATRLATGVVGTAALIGTKSLDIVARPQQLFSKQFWKDIGHNIVHTPGAILKTIWGTFNKNLRSTKKHTYSRNIFQDYGKSRTETKNPVKKVLWFLGKFVGVTPASGLIWPVPSKFILHLSNGIWLSIEETLQWIKNSKRHWNPKNWNLKSFNYDKTKEIFKKAFKWNHKNKLGAEKETKVVGMNTEAKEEKKAA